MKRLSNKTQSLLPAKVLQPQYDRDCLKAGIVHIGIGAFHKAHQAVYTDTVLGTIGGDWGIIGVSLRRSYAEKTLSPQDGLYVVGVRSNEVEQKRLIGSILTVITSTANSDAVLKHLSAPNIHVITLTITEKGYCLLPDTGKLDTQHEDIAFDLANARNPKSAIGYLSEALRQRFVNGVSAPTIISCDNIHNNGKKLRSAVLQYIKLTSPTLLEWVEKSVTFPSTMVDRIVPATSEVDIKNNSEEIGLFDKAYVNTEPYSQWVIENNFSGPKPDWQTAGALFVKDVTHYELAKLRLLNGAHSAIAYLGALADIDFVHEVMSNKTISSFITQLMDNELAPTVPKISALPLIPYSQELRKRFENSSLLHQTEQIAMDGSQKLPQRILSAINERYARNEPTNLLCLTVAAWICFTKGENLTGQSIAISDPYSNEFKSIWHISGDVYEDVVIAFLRIDSIFSIELSQNQHFQTELTFWVNMLMTTSVLETLNFALNTVRTQTSYKKEIS